MSRLHDFAAVVGAGTVFWLVLVLFGILGAAVLQATGIAR